MKGDVRVTYRTVFPEAEETEWKRKGTCLERTVRVVKLIDMSVDAEAVFGGEADSKDLEENVSQLEALERGATPAGVLDQSNWVLDRTMMWQVLVVYGDTSPIVFDS